MKISQPL